MKKTLMHTYQARMTRSDEEVNTLRNAILERIEEGGSSYSGMSYEQGIDETIRWLFGESDDHPYDE